ncbi:MAG TPA: LCP family protein [Catenuloplanes sp.]|jgi:LCP family protein required for cell wall assembly
MPVQTRQRPAPVPDGTAMPRVRRAEQAEPPGRLPGAVSRRQQDPLWARLTVIFGAVLMMLSGGAIVGSKALIGQATDAITQSNLIGDAGKTAAEGGNNLRGPVDLLLLGVDARAQWHVNDTRADTIIVLHIPASHDQAYLISIPRDTQVEMPADPKTGFAGGPAKANEAFFFGARHGGWPGGAQMMAKTIKKLTGMSFDGAAIIDFGGFRGVIEALGGVKMCVDQRVQSQHMTLVDGRPHWNADAKRMTGRKEPVVHKVGCRNMAGWEALDFSRQRYGLTNGDYDRQRHQQQLIKAMAKKAMDGGVVTNPLKLNGLMQAAGKAFVLDTGGTPVADFIFTLKGITANELMLLRTNGGTFRGNGAGREELDPISQEMFKALREDRVAEFVVANPQVVAREK